MASDDLDRDARALLPVPPVTTGLPRRRALKVALGLGYAAAAGPLMAQTAIRTPSDGLTVGEVTIDVQGYPMPAYRAQPAGRTGLPVVLVLSEVFGVHEYIADVTHRYAREGYLAVAPELFVRQGDPQSYGQLAKLMDEVVSKVPDAQVAGDVDATLAWAVAAGGDPARVAVTGFCWGGRQTWLYAAHSARVRAAVAWYGRLEGESSALAPLQPLDLASRVQAPVLGFYGGADPSIPQESLTRMKAALAKGTPAARACEFVVYPDAPHGFHADYRTSYRQDAAQDSWRRALAWLRAHGVA